MKSALNFLLLIFGLLLANIAHAESPREQLQQMVEQLQQTPSDTALRERIIKLATTLKPSLAVPDAAIAFEGRARLPLITPNPRKTILLRPANTKKPPPPRRGCLIPTSTCALPTKRLASSPMPNATVKFT